MSFLTCELGNLFFLYRESTAANFVKIHRLLKSKINIIHDNDDSNFVYLQDSTSKKYLYCNFDDPDNKIYVGDNMMKFELIKIIINDIELLSFKHKNQFLYANSMINHLTLDDNKTDFILQ